MKKGPICHNQTSHQHLLRNELNVEYFMCDNSMIYLTSMSMVFECMNKLENRSIIHGKHTTCCIAIKHLTTTEIFSLIQIHSLTHAHTHTHTRTWKSNSNVYHV